MNWDNARKSDRNKELLLLYSESCKDPALEKAVVVDLLMYLEAVVLLQVVVLALVPEWAQEAETEVPEQVLVRVVEEVLLL